MKGGRQGETDTLFPTLGRGGGGGSAFGNWDYIAICIDLSMVLYTQNNMLIIQPISKLQVY